MWGEKGGGTLDNLGVVVVVDAMHFDTHLTALAHATLDGENRTTQRLIRLMMVSPVSRQSVVSGYPMGIDRRTLTRNVWVQPPV